MDVPLQAIMEVHDNQESDKVWPTQPTHFSVQHDHLEMSASSDGPTSPTSRRFSRIGKRARLKNGTFILPGTGERVRRQITLRLPSNLDGPVRSESDGPGLSVRRTNTASYGRSGTFDVARARWKKFTIWLQTPTAKGILKCSLAYLLGCMGTLFPPFANFLGHQDGKHMVATITVYFHPARSAGSMEEAALLGFAAFLYATFISFSSMATAVFFENQLNLIEIAYAIVLIVFCGGGLGLVGWVKQRFSAPLVSVACSLASLAIITVLTKENAIHVGMFDDDKIVQVMKMVVMGIIATSAVSLLIWPISARTELRESIIKVTDSFGDMLSMITTGFLSGSEAEMKSPAFESAQRRYKAVFTQLTKNLQEAKMEHYVLGTEKEFILERRLVSCMQQLAQSIGGLRSAANTQFALLNEVQIAGASSPALGYPFPKITGENLRIRNDHFGLTSIEEVSDEGSDVGDRSFEPDSINRQSSMASMQSAHVSIAKTPSDIFSRFMKHLGPSMKSLAYTLTQILEELPFGEGPKYEIMFNAQFETSLTEALALYGHARADALKHLYHSKDLDRKRPENVEADFEEVAASCGHFSFSLQAFGAEMQTFLSILEDFKDLIEAPGGRSWNWLCFWRHWRRKDNTRKTIQEEQEPLIEAATEHPHMPKTPKDDPALNRRDERKWRDLRKKPKGLYLRGLRIARWLTRDDVRFAFKVGIGAALYALFAFIPATRPFYRHWRGEWGLLSYMLVCTITIGASNTTGWSRFFGTAIGAVVAVVVWLITQGNAFAIAFFGWLVSLPCFYIIIAQGKGPFGRFVMLTYNLSCLYAYSLSIKEGDDDDDEGGVAPIITEIVLHRVVAVLAGVIWGMIITRVIWPISARKKFKDGLSMMWLRMALIWKRDPLSVMLEGESATKYMNLNEEFALQAHIVRLQALRLAAVSEFDLRGPFQSSIFSRIMDSTTRILDAFHAMNLVIQKDPNVTAGEATLLKHTSGERAALCARISHLFQVLASSLKLEYPLNNALPDTTSPRDRLLAKIYQYRKNGGRQDDDDDVEAGAEDDNNMNRDETATDEDYELLYAYTLVTGQIAAEIKKIEKDIEQLFGVIDEDMFEL